MQKDAWGPGKGQGHLNTTKPLSVTMEQFPRKSNSGSGLSLPSCSTVPAILGDSVGRTTNSTQFAGDFPGFSAS